MDVLVVDDQDALLDLVARPLERDGHHVRVTRTVNEAALAMAELRFDVIVLDVALPDGSGLDAGADDFLGKPFAPDELRARVRALGRRRSSPTAFAWQGQRVELDVARRRATAASLDVLVGRVRKKLGDDVVRTVRGEGYAPGV